jgi:RluA family pseudouridine synthase
VRAAHLVHLGDRFAVVNKPAGLSLATPRSEPREAVRRLVAALPAAEREALAGRELHLVHRLDEPTSGLVVVALDADEHRRLTTAFARRQVSKSYLALVWGHPRPKAARIDRPLGPDRADRRRMKVDPAGRAAITDRQVLAVAPHVALVALWPRTGRTHQLRVHLAAAGHPIVGDDLYGGPRHRAVRDAKLRSALEPGRALLHAWRLELPGDEPSRFEAPLPGDFRAALAAAGLPLAPPGDLWQAPANLSGLNEHTA